MRVIAMINIALPKGRLGEKVYDILQGAGYGVNEDMQNSRKLIFSDENENVSYFWVKPADVTTYVELGAADIGFAGKDIIDECSPDVYEFYDLGIGKCKMCVAAKRGFEDDLSKPLRVATKFVHSAEKYFLSRGREIKIIKLNGSIELAPVLNISDVIFDIVETGTTLKENNLVVIAEAYNISCRLVVNKAAYKFKQAEIDALVCRIKEVTKND
jgi:ATP phosphoribosyltransferase